MGSFCRGICLSAKIDVVTPQDPTEPSLPLSSGTVSEVPVSEVVPPNGVPITEAGVPAVDPAAAVNPDDDPHYERPRSTLAEWTITVLLLLFLTTTLVQAYVIPTG